TGWKKPPFRATCSHCPASCTRRSNRPTAINTIQPPPRFLLGAALLFWGGMTWHPVIAVILALLVESARMTRLRWNFDDNAAIRAWQLSVLASGAMAVLIWLDGDPVNALPRLLGWLP